MVIIQASYVFAPCDPSTTGSSGSIGRKRPAHLRLVPVSKEQIKSDPMGESGSDKRRQLRMSRRIRLTRVLFGRIGVIGGKAQGRIASKNVFSQKTEAKVRLRKPKGAYFG